MAQAPLEFHRLQLTSVYATLVSASRRPQKEGDPEEPMFKATQAQAVRSAAGEVGFHCTVKVSIEIPVLGDEMFRGAVTLEAYFVGTSEQPIPLTLARRFAREQAVYLVWPFARAYLNTLSMIAGVGVPPLPMLVVPRPGSARP